MSCVEQASIRLVHAIDRLSPSLGTTSQFQIHIDALRMQFQQAPQFTFNVMVALCHNQVRNAERNFQFIWSPALALSRHSRSSTAWRPRYFRDPLTQALAMPNAAQVKLTRPPPKTAAPSDVIQSTARSVCKHLVANGKDQEPQHDIQLFQAHRFIKILQTSQACPGLRPNLRDYLRRVFADRSAINPRAAWAANSASTQKGCWQSAHRPIHPRKQQQTTHSPTATAGLQISLADRVEQAGSIVKAGSRAL